MKKPVLVTDTVDKTIDAIERCIDQPPENSRVFTITPHTAGYLLDKYNKVNRPMKPVKISEYRDDMKENSWRLTGDTIKFSDARLLRDGQNRLRACVDAGVAFRTHVVFGIEDSAFIAMDRGKNRDGSDLLAIDGVHDTKTIAAAVRWAQLIETDRVKARTTFPPDEILHLYRTRYKGELDAFAPQANRIYRAAVQPRGLICALLYLFHKANPKIATEFALAWETGTPGGRFSPITRAQTTINTSNNRQVGGRRPEVRVHDVVRVALLILAWNAVVARKTPRSITWTLDQDFPEIAS